MPGRRGYAFDSDTHSTRIRLNPTRIGRHPQGASSLQKPPVEAYFGFMPEDPRRLTREATFRSPSGAIFRRVELIDGQLPPFVDLPAAGRSGTRNHYILTLNDPVRRVYRWQGQLDVDSTA